MGAAVRRGRRTADGWAAILSGWTPLPGSVAFAVVAGAADLRCHRVVGLDGPPLGGAHGREVLMKGRSGSQKRKTSARIAVNCTPAQKAAILKKAADAQVSPSAICLAMMLDAPLPRHHQPTVNDAALKKYLEATAKLTDAVYAVRAELGKSGSNLNQIAYMLNANTAPARIMNIVESGIEEHRALVAKYDSAIENDLPELRTMTMQAFGIER